MYEASVPCMAKYSTHDVSSLPNTSMPIPEMLIIDSAMWRQKVSSAPSSCRMLRPESKAGSCGLAASAKNALTATATLWATVSFLMYACSGAAGLPRM